MITRFAPSSRPTIFGLVMSALSNLGASTSALASAGHVSGWGTRAGFTFGGDVQIAADSSVSGHFTIIQDLPDGLHQSCRYTRLYRGDVSRGQAQFYGTGVCHGPYGWYTSQNFFTIVDHGSPGTGVDTIDVNFLGVAGISIPGGVLASGDLSVTP
jgi:hypothetical protein